jgi:hypothetical protein
VAPAPLATNYATTDKWPDVSFTNPIQVVVQPPGDSARLIVVDVVTPGFVCNVNPASAIRESRSGSTLCRAARFLER